MAHPHTRTAGATDTSPEPSAAAVSLSAGLSPGVRRITLNAERETVTGLLGEPADVPSRGLVVALHGGGMSAGYFDGQAHPDVSLLTLGPRLGYTVLALDRPGYGPHARRRPDGLTVTDQVGPVAAAVEELTDRHAGHGGTLLLGHSFGGKLALAVAAYRPPRALLGVEVSGVGHRLAVPPERAGQRSGIGSQRLNWGPLHLYPPGTFRASASVVSPMPRREVDSVADWADVSADVLPRVRVPVRFTFAEHEAWWRHAPEDVAGLVDTLTQAPRVVVDRLPRAGHNISLGWAARAYHLRALAFLEECREAAHAVRDGPP
ncbi:alpha/beta hydrolase family protein [Streptomyces flaveolus]|uniref:Alpha/beta hydrolase family protein n=1 Tax=Streptomyces flaveolus TaxID=67297 RepID=A0ABV1VHN4_9ACTN